MTVEEYQAQLLSYADAGLWALIGLAAFTVFALGVLLVRVVW